MQQTVLAVIRVIGEALHGKYAVAYNKAHACDGEKQGADAEILKRSTDGGAAHKADEGAVDAERNEELAHVKQIVRALQPQAQILECNYGDVDLERLLNTGRFNFNEVATSAAWINEIENHHGDEEDDDDDDEHEHHHHDHEDEDHEHHHHDHEDEEHEHHHHADEVFSSWGLETIVPCDKDELKEILEELAYGNGYGDVLRAKGMLPSENPGEWYYFDLVPEEYEIRTGTPDYTGKVCVIGANLKEEELNRAFGRS